MHRWISVFIALIFIVTYHRQLIASNYQNTNEIRVVDISPLPGQQMTLADLEKRYPEAEIRPIPLGHLEDEKARHSEQEIDECGGAQQVSAKNSNGDDRDYAPRVNANSYGHSGGGNSKDFLILVAVVGVIIVAALVVYSIGYLLKSGSNLLKCSAWKDFGARFTYFFEDSKVQLREGRLTGIYFTSGYRVPFGIMGLTTEVGTFNLDMQIKKSLKLKQIGDPYLLVGPSFSLPFKDLNGHRFQIELLAGSSANKGIGLISTMRFGLLFRLAPSLSWGLNTGAALINVKGFDNFLEDHDQLNSIWGTSISYLW
jgi:hypothetical protein